MSMKRENVDTLLCKPKNLWLIIKRGSCAGDFDLTGFKNVLAALKRKEVKWFNSLTGKQQTEIRKRLRRIYFGDMEKVHIHA